MPRFTPNPLAVATLVAMAQLAPLAHAQAAAEEPSTDGGASTEKKSGKLSNVTVTAERRVANVQKTSIAMQVVSGSEIAEQGLTSGSEILKSATNVEVQGAARGALISMRGVGSDMPPGMGESAVSTNYDSVYSFRAENATLGFFDLERVEVLRGPQGTLYGRNAASGAVNFLTRDPVIGKSGGQASLELGNYSLLRGEVGFNVPVNDMIALRASAASVSRSGYLTDGFNDAKATGARVKVLFKPNSDLRVLAGVERLHLGGKGVGMIPDANWNNRSTRLTAEQNVDSNGIKDGAELVGYQDFNGTKLWAQVDANLGFATLTLLPGYQKAEGDVYRKWDASHRGAETWSHDPDPTLQKSMEARLASHAGSALQWVVGAYYYDMSTVLQCYLGCGTSPRTEDTTTSKAIFGQVNYSLMPGLRAIVGMRHSEDKKTNLSRPEGETWRSNDGKLALEYDVSPNAMAYATYATAYRPGGFNTFNTDSPRFDAEHLGSFELGLKSRLLDNTLQVNAALFQMNYRNYQAIDNYLNPAPTTSNDFFLSTVLNVPKQTIRGLEAEAQYLLPSGGKLRGSLTWLDAKLGNLRLHDYGSAVEFSMAGKPLPHAPSATLKLGAEQPFQVGGGAITLRGDVRYTDKQYVSITENAATLQEAYTQLDVSAQYRPDSDKWGVNVYVKNLSNYVPKTGEFFGYSTVGAPRTVGVVLTAKF
jgi:iron complex outermembrane recepter protein